MLPIQEPLAVAQFLPADETSVVVAKLTLSACGGTTEKPVNDCFKSGNKVVWRKNEDRFRIDDNPNSLLACVADGAGSSGMYCGPWAEALVERLPQSPIGAHDDLNSWIDGFWQDFSDRHKKEASAHPTKLSKFVREGSCSTLAGCWFSRSADGTSLTLHWLGYGDSPILVFQHNEQTLSLSSCFPDSLAAMESDPHLLNWKDLPDARALKTGTITFEGPATVVVASDGVGLFVLLRYLSELHFRQSANAIADYCETEKKLLGEFRQIMNSGSGKLASLARAHMENPGDGLMDDLQAFRQTLESGNGFSDLIKDHHAKGLLPNDDSTLVVIDIANEQLNDGEATYGSTNAVNSP
jgi:hypothetical protein